MEKPFSVVCVGASAGGLEALISFLKILPKKINMAFVLIQHLEPQHKSALTEILSRETRLNIREAKNNVKVEVSHIYIIPPNSLISIVEGRLKITVRKKRMDGRYLPIDYFMTSLAVERREKAIGIVLSGTGSDGTVGMKAIKTNGGITFAQNEKSARYFGMPGSAIASGSADYVLEPGAIAKKLVQIDKQGFRIPVKLTNDQLKTENIQNTILTLLRDHTGVDFIHYKKTTVSRRIARRMLFHNFKNYSEYYDYIKRNPAESDHLLKDILIPVTSFFRDPEVFLALKKKVFPLVVKNCSAKNPVRIWVPACSTGEEVYSVAITLYEYAEKKNIKPRFQIFGTDLSDEHIVKARSGTYTKDISSSVSNERLRRFFTKTETGFKIGKNIRELCIFAKHDITNDPPLSNMDIESCRNLLIYMDTYLQNKALSMLHYALKPAGFLVLGTSESVTAVPGLFGVVDKKLKIYSKNNVVRKSMTDTGLSTTKLKKKVADDVGIVKSFIPAASKSALIKKKNTPAKTVSVNKKNANTEKDISKLRKEYARAVELLNAISEEKDTFNEELKAANEEIQSSNEELQSMNEELETSKEELQSTNEELMTLNEELQNNNVELTNLNSDLSNVFASTNIPMIIVGNDMCIKRFTPTARKVMNLIPEDVGRPIGDIKLNIDIVNLEEMIADVIDDMLQKESEVKDKEGRWYSVRIRPYRTLDNRIDGAVITMIDIDAVKRSREDVQFALEYAQAIIETMREPLAVLDKDARILSVNKSFVDMFKVKISDIKNKSIFELDAHQWDYPGLRKLLGEILPMKNYFNDFEMSYIFSGMEKKFLILNGRQIKMQGYEKQMILLVIEDITRRREAEDILKRDSESLERLIVERSSDLLDLEVRLERSKHLSDIGTLAATIAHELRNTLASINVSSFNIRKKINDARIDGNLDNIDKKILEGNQIINNVLFYSKIKSSDLKSVTLNDILEKCINETRERIINHGITIHENLKHTDGLYIEADRIQLKEVFFNILNNALDAVNKDTGIIKIESAISDLMVKIVIKDNGEGIDKDDLKKVVDPFFTTKAKGTGLGLSVCSQILMLHGGTLDIDSVKGHWTEVSVTLPIKRKNTKNI